VLTLKTLCDRIPLVLQHPYATATKKRTVALFGAALFFAIFVLIINIMLHLDGVEANGAPRYLFATSSDSPRKHNVFSLQTTLNLSFSKLAVETPGRSAEKLARIRETGPAAGRKVG
jgi:hypothetical protein